MVPPSSVANTTRAICIAHEKRTSRTRSATTTIASTVSLSRPRAPVSVITAAVIVGEKLTTITTSSATMASRAAPVASGATGSQGHAIHRSTARPAMATASVAPVIWTMAMSRLPMRSRLSVSPAMSAMSVVAIPVITWSWPAIDSVMTLPMYGPTMMPNSR